MSTAPFPELDSESAAISWTVIDPTKVLGRRRSRWFPVWPVAAEVAEGVVREGMAVDGAGAREGRAHPSRCPAWKVRGLRFVGGGERIVVMGRELSLIHI